MKKVKWVNDPLTNKQYPTLKQIIEAHNVSANIFYAQRRKHKTLKQALEYAIAHTKARVIIDPNTNKRYKSYKELVTAYGIDYTIAVDTKNRKGISYEDQVKGLTLVVPPVLDVEPVKEEITKLVESLDTKVHPEHYTYSKYECIEVLKDILGSEGFKEFCRGNVFKYLWRYNHKNGKEDLLKAKYYLEKLIEVLN